jgi:hypothetical protein
MFGDDKKNAPGADISSEREDDHDKYFGLSHDDLKESGEETAQALPRRGRPMRPDWVAKVAPPILSPERERELIVAAQAGDARAFDALYQAYLPWLRAETFRRWRSLNRPRPKGSRHPDIERGMAFEDFFGYVRLAFWRAIVNYAPANNGLNAYLRPWIAGALSDAAHEWRNYAGLQIDSRIQRVIRAHPNASAEAIRNAKFPNLSVADVEREQLLALPMQPLDALRYSEAQFAGDGGEHDKNAFGEGFKSVGATEVNEELLAAASPISEWTRRATFPRFEKYFADHVANGRTRLLTANDGFAAARVFANSDLWATIRKPIAVDGYYFETKDDAAERRALVTQRQDREYGSLWRELDAERLAALLAKMEAQQQRRSHSHLGPGNVVIPSSTRLPRVKRQRPKRRKFAPAAQPEFSLWDVAHPRREMTLRRSLNLAPELTTSNNVIALPSRSAPPMAWPVALATLAVWSALMADEPPLAFAA